MRDSTVTSGHWSTSVSPTIPNVSRSGSHAPTRGNGTVAAEVQCPSSTKKRVGGVPEYGAEVEQINTRSPGPVGDQFGRPSRPLQPAIIDVESQRPVERQGLFGNL
ncbi:MAG: hypothetical protein CM1200mP2_22800 [Planctomycetaceae bacterium]|nr:MAG: hypothetical protein CM1200mP2_22800 [Planctomycetaceae bacterium]